VKKALAFLALALLLGGAIAHLDDTRDVRRSAGAGRPVALRPMTELAGSESGGETAPPEKEAPPPAPAPAAPDAEAAHAKGKDLLRLREKGASIEEIRRAEQEFNESLDALPPLGVVGVLIETPAPVVNALILDRIDRGLAEDRRAWETALVLGVEETAEDPRRLEQMCHWANDRVLDDARRAQAALLVMKMAKSDRLLAWVGRLAAGDAVEEIREFLWSKAPAPGAIEGLGYVLRAQDATRLEALGAMPAVLRALENAYRRTADPQFRDSLSRLGQ
jgi:hypothetical protein